MWAWEQLQICTIRVRLPPLEQRFRHEIGVLRLEVCRHIASCERNHAQYSRPVSRSHSSAFARLSVPITSMMKSVGAHTRDTTADGLITFRLKTFSGGDAHRTSRVYVWWRLQPKVLEVRHHVRRGSCEASTTGIIARTNNNDDTTKCNHAPRYTVRPPLPSSSTSAK